MFSILWVIIEARVKQSTIYCLAKEIMNYISRSRWCRSSANNSYLPKGEIDIECNEVVKGTQYKEFNITGTILVRHSTHNLIKFALPTQLLKSFRNIPDLRYKTPLNSHLLLLLFYPLHFHTKKRPQIMISLKFSIWKIGIVLWVA